MKIGKNKVKKGIFIGYLRSNYREKRIKHWQEIYDIDYTCEYSKNKIIPCIYNVMHKIPINIFNIIMDWGVYFFIMDNIGNIRLHTVKTSNKNNTFKKFVITLNGVFLKEKPNEEIEHVIAHELAHMIQSISRAKSYDEIEYAKCYKDDERKADKTIEKWGFPIPEEWKKSREMVYNEMNR